MTVKKTADLVDRHDAKLAFCDHPLVKFGAAQGFEGEIATVKCFEDNALLRETLEQPGDGRVPVVDGGARPDAPLWATSSPGSPATMAGRAS